jgi:hypothetical protein
MKVNIVHSAETVVKSLRRKIISLVNLKALENIETYENTAIY